MVVTRRGVSRRVARRPRPTAVLAALVAGTILTACSTTPSAAKESTTTRSPATTSSTTTSLPPTTSTPSTSTTTTTAAVSQPCSGPSLKVSRNATSGAGATVAFGFAVLNEGASRCTIAGYPAVELRTGSSSTAVTSHAGQGPAFRAAPRVLTVPAGKTVGFVFEYSPVQTNGCQVVSYDQLDVTLPVSSAAPVVVQAKVQACSASVSALVPSSDEQSQFS